MFGTTRPESIAQVFSESCSLLCRFHTLILIPLSLPLFCGWGWCTLGVTMDKKSVRVLTTGHLIAGVECQTERNNCYKYLKVPYAQPPVGKTTKLLTRVKQLQRELSSRPTISRIIKYSVELKRYKILDIFIIDLVWVIEFSYCVGNETKNHEQNQLIVHIFWRRWCCCGISIMNLLFTKYLFSWAKLVSLSFFSELHTPNCIVQSIQLCCFSM